MSLLKMKLVILSFRDSFRRYFSKSSRILRTVLA